MQISRVTRVSNPRGRRASSRKRRNPKRLSLKQKLHFGSARQRAAAKASLRKKRSNPKRRVRAANPHRRRAVKAAPVKRRRRRANPPHLITLGLINPRPSTGKPKRRKKSSMAKTHKRRSTRRRASANPRRRRRNSVRVIVRRSRRRATSNPRRRRRRVSANPRRRRINVRHRRHSTGRRRNPVVFGQSVSALGMAKIVAAGLAGVAITKAVPNMLPAGLLPASPFTASLVSLAVAVGAGMLVSSLLKGDPMVGYAVGFGGMMQAGSVMLNAFLPQVGSMIGLQGLGDLVPGRFPIPQNPIMAGNQMMLPAPMPAGPSHAAAGVGAIFNPFGRAM